MLKYFKLKIRRLLEAICQRSFVASQAYQSRKLARHLARCNGHVLVYQMGKVGSTSVLKSLRQAAPHLAVHHVHMLSDAATQRFRGFVRGTFRSPLVGPAARDLFVHHLVTVDYLRKQQQDSPGGPSWKVISLVREPVGRNLSSFFEILDAQMHYGLEDRLGERGFENVLADLSHLFLDEYPDHNVPLEFFDVEIKATLGIDVFSVPFARSKGYQTYSAGRVSLLVLRVENLDRCGTEAIGGFLEIPGFQLENANVGEDKFYAGVYRRLTREIRLPHSYLDRMYRSRYATHFYSDREIEDFRNRWTRPAVPWPPPDRSAAKSKA